MVDVIANEMRIGLQRVRLVLVFLGAEIDNRREFLFPDEAAQYVDTVAVAMATA